MITVNENRITPHCFLYGKVRPWEVLDGGLCADRFETKEEAEAFAKVLEHDNAINCTIEYWLEEVILPSLFEQFQLESGDARKAVKEYMEAV